MYGLEIHLSFRLELKGFSGGHNEVSTIRTLLAVASIGLRLSLLRFESLYHERCDDVEERKTFVFPRTYMDDQVFESFPSADPSPNAQALESDRGEAMLRAAQYR